jgi:HEXXH motif-containing protein
MEQLSGLRPRLALTQPEFDRLAAGHNSPEIIRKLQLAQLSRTILLTKRIADNHPALAGAARQLGDAHDVDPAAVRPVLDWPWFSVWAVHRILGRGASLRPDYLPNATLAAAALAGWTDTPIPVRPCEGVVAVPGLGVLRRPTELVKPADLTGPEWTPLRAVRCDHQRLTLRLAIDDVDPYRDCFGIPPTPRLTEDRAAGLGRSVAEAWRVLVDNVPTHAAELGAGLNVLVPLMDTGGSQHSITHSDGFGAFAASPDLDAFDLAATMVHEFQHSKLSAVLHLVGLFDRGDPTRYFSPWRRDPRPIGGLLQGVYAFVAVAELWAALRAHARVEDRAIRQFALVRRQVERGVRELARARGLTPAGNRWADRLAERGAALLAEPVPAALDRAARATVAEAERRRHDR